MSMRDNSPVIPANTTASIGQPRMAKSLAPWENWWRRHRSKGISARKKDPTPYHGYCYRILQAQGPHAPDGALNYVENGKMDARFASVAYPADYDNFGIMTFIMGSDGVVYQKDLGRPDRNPCARYERIRSR